VRSLVALVVAASLLAGCGADDDAEEPVADATTTTTEAAVAYPAGIEARPSAGCGAAATTAAPTTRERRTIDVDGTERWYLLSVPAAHDGTEPLSLVVELHGLAEGAGIAAEMSQIDGLGETEGFVSVFPNGSGEPVRWDQSIDETTPNADMAFIDQLLDELSSELCLDEARTYVTGLSYGAIMSSALGCTRADRFAAIAPVAGIERPDGCEPSRPVPVLSFHGTADAILLFNGGIGDLGSALGGGTPEEPTAAIDLDGPGYPEAVAAWAEANGCGAATDERHSEHVIARTYDCDDDAEVTFFIVEGGGHTWPNSAFSTAIASVVGATTTEIDATKEIWAFFERHALPAAETPS
jgi:polyhydroxybutyrate depolymerase